MFLRKLALLFVFILFCNAPAHALADPGMRDLCVLSFPEEKILWQEKLPDGENDFSLFFIHSVSKTEVEDQYRVNGPHIIQTAELFIAHGAGLPSLKDEVGEQSWTLENGQFVLKMDRPIDKLVLRVNPDYRNRLVFDGTDLDITQWGRRALLIRLCE
ncbi:MAG: DUF1850 domain-containing protein [Alphaproteobacteria bacterium]|nr:MAG: DUF1850 domain-containing protein [Alphaproteobacteria bacterium]